MLQLPSPLSVGGDACIQENVPPLHHLRPSHSFAMGGTSVLPSLIYPTYYVSEILSISFFFGCVCGYYMIT